MLLDVLPGLPIRVSLPLPPFTVSWPPRALGKRTDVSSERARTTLGWTPTSISDTIAEAAESLIAHGVVGAPAATPG